MMLVDLFNLARRLKWCNRLGCTTCGCLPFRSAIKRVIDAAADAGPESALDALAGVRRYQEAVITASLKRLDSQGYLGLMLRTHGSEFSYDLGLLMYDCGLFATSRSELDALWAESPVLWGVVNEWITARELRSRRKAAAASASNIDETPEERLARKARERIERSSRHHLRIARQRDHNAFIRERLAYLTSLPFEAQFEVLSNTDDPFPLGPVVVTPQLVDAARWANQEVAERLLARIGRRKGAWRAVARALRGHGQTG